MAVKTEREAVTVMPRAELHVSGALPGPFNEVVVFVVQHTVFISIKQNLIVKFNCTPSLDVKT